MVGLKNEKDIKKIYDTLELINIILVNKIKNKYIVKKIIDYVKGYILDIDTSKTEKEDKTYYQLTPLYTYNMYDDDIDINSYFNRCFDCRERAGCKITINSMCYKHHKITLRRYIYYEYINSRKYYDPEGVKFPSFEKSSIGSILNTFVSMYNDEL